MLSGSAHDASLPQGSHSEWCDIKEDNPIHGANPNQLPKLLMTEIQMRSLLDNGDFDQLSHSFSKSNANVINEFGNTPLIVCAAYPGSINLLKVLIELGGDPNYISESGASPLSRCISGGSTHGSNTLDELDFLLKSGADPELSIECGYRAIHWAVANNKPHHLELLLKNGADVNALTFDFIPDSAYAIAQKMGMSACSNTIEMYLNKS